MKTMSNHRASWLAVFILVVPWSLLLLWLVQMIGE